MVSTIDANIVIAEDLGFGDSGKATTVDYESAQAGACWNIRFCGGGQAGHNAVLPGGIEHCFSQIGSGSFNPRVRTFFSREMVVEPFALEIEAELLRRKGVLDIWERIFVDPNCLVTTPYHKLVNQLRELARGSTRHGSMGRGVGETVLDATVFPELTLRFRDLWDAEILERKLRFLAAQKLDQAEQIIDSVRENEALKKTLELFFERNDSLLEDYLEFAAAHPQILAAEDFFSQLILAKELLIFEGAQGTLIDLEFGFWPYVTKTRTTTHNAEEMLRDFSGKIRRVGILRGYFTRHGRGPFVTEESSLNLSEKHNETNLWQEHFRCGWFDLVAARYAIAANKKIDEIFLTCLDKMRGLSVVKVCLSYEYFGHDFDSLNHWFEWHRTSDNRLKITAIKIVGNERNPAFAEVLNNCRPFEFAEFAGWNFESEHISCFADLPVELREYVDFLEKALSVPIRTVSVGPTALDKFRRE